MVSMTWLFSSVLMLSFLVAALLHVMMTMTTKAPKKKAPPTVAIQVASYRSIFIQLAQRVSQSVAESVLGSWVAPLQKVFFKCF